MGALADRLGGVGLRWRIAGWAAAVMLACLAIAFVAVYRGTGSHLRGQVDSEVSGEAHELAHALAVADAPNARTLSRVATQYVRSRPFSSSSTLLFVIVPGVGTATNRPELFRPERPDNGETQVIQERENRLAAQLVRAPLGDATLDVPDVGGLRLLTSRMKVEGDATPVTIGTGEPLASVAQAQEGVARAFILAGVLALLGALLGGYAIGSRASQPLRGMAALAGRVDAGDLHPRIHATARMPAEVRVMAEAFNHMLDRLTAAFTSQRDFVADASHELRTPLTVIRGQVEVLSESEHPTPEELHRVERLLQAEVVRVDRLIDDLLLLAQLEQDEFLQPQPVALEPFVEDLWRSTTVIGERRFALGRVPAGTLSADPDRLMQALRNLLTNAIKHTAEGEGEVSMSVALPAPGVVRFVIEDDGPGIPPDERERVFERFHRTDGARDRATGGAGLGLAIVQAIAHAHGGEARAGESSMGGARFELELPGFTPAAPADGLGLAERERSAAPR